MSVKLTEGEPTLAQSASKVTTLIYLVALVVMPWMLYVNCQESRRLDAILVRNQALLERTQMTLDQNQAALERQQQLLEPARETLDPAADGLP